MAQPAFAPVVPAHHSAKTLGRWSAIAIAALMLGACTTKAVPRYGYAFGVATDPQAAMVGQAVLGHGGNAVDAATAMGFVMAVSLPSRVGLGGGGVCLVHDPKRREVRALDFLPRASGTGAGGTGAAVPGLVSGLAMLHAAYGQQRWEQTVGTAETMAGTGFTVSRALSADLQQWGGSLARDPEARRTLLSGSATPPPEGARLVQPDLAALLRVVRLHGAGGFYGSGGAPREAALRIAEGLRLPPEALAAYRARWQPTQTVEAGRDLIHFPVRADGSDGGLTRAWEALAEMSEAEWPARIAGLLPADAGAAVPTAALVVVDSFEQGVACVFTQGAGFGSGRMAPGLGVFPAVPASAAGVGGPVMRVNPHLNTTLFAGAGWGLGGGDGQAAARGVLTALRRSVVDRVPAEQVLDTALPAEARVEAVACLFSRNDGLKFCNVATDPRGSGMTFNQPPATLE